MSGAGVYRPSIGWTPIAGLIVSPSRNEIAAIAGPDPELEPGDWRDEALCAETDPEAFFPERGGSTREAKSVCAACPVKAPCLEYALEHGNDVGRFGVWGGTSERERRRIHAQRTLGVAA